MTRQTIFSLDMAPVINIYFKAIANLDKNVASYGQNVFLFLSLFCGW